MFKDGQSVYIYQPISVMSVNDESGLCALLKSEDKKESFLPWNHLPQDAMDAIYSFMFNEEIRDLNCCMYCGLEVLFQPVIFFVTRYPRSPDNPSPSSSGTMCRPCIHDVGYVDDIVLIQATRNSTTKTNSD